MATASRWRRLLSRGPCQLGVSALRSPAAMAEIGIEKRRTSMSGSADRAAFTLAEVAAQAGVSVPTVSKVINGRADVAPATRDRVQRVLAEHGYVLSRSRQAAQPARWRADRFRRGFYRQRLRCGDSSRRRGRAGGYHCASRIGVDERPPTARTRLGPQAGYALDGSAAPLASSLPTTPPCTYKNCGAT